MLPQLVEEVDIFPSLLDLAGISIPKDLQGILISCHLDPIRLLPMMLKEQVLFPF